MKIEKENFMCSFSYFFQSMYALMAKCEELSTSMEPVNKLAEQMYPLFNVHKIWNVHVYIPIYNL